MALGFFRRRQKMVIIIMAILMVSFLIGFQGFERLFVRRGGGFEMGRSRYGALTNQDLRRAEFELAILRRLPRPGPDVDLVQVLVAREPELTYALLVKEATGSPVRVNLQDVDTFIRETRLSGAELNSFMDRLKQDLNAGREHLEQAVAHWVAVRKCHLLSTAMAPPSDQQLRRLFRDLSERIQLQYVRLDAHDYLDRAGDVDEVAVQEQFRQYRDVAPRTLASADSFGFGYRQGDRVRLSYLLIRPDLVERAIRPDEELLRDYYRQHMAEFVEEPASQPDQESQTQSAGGQAQTAPAGDEAVTSTAPAGQPRQLSYAQAKPRIVQQLSQQVVQQRVRELANRLNSLADQRAAETKDGEPLDWARAQLLAPAAAVLQRQLADVRIQSMPLEEALGVLVEKAGLEAVAFPVGEFGDTSVSPSIEVTLEAPQITLGEALARLAEQARLPELTWMTSPAFEGVLFTVGPIETFPVQAGQTKLLDRRKMEVQEVLGQAQGPGGAPLAEYAFNTRELGDVRSELASVEVGQRGQEAYVEGAEGGLLLWRLVEASRSFSPESMDAIEGLREQVVKDIKLQRAFELALEQARSLAQAARQQGLSAAGGPSRQILRTELISRLTMTYPQQQIMSFIQRLSQEIRPRLLVQVYLAKPVDFEPPALEELALPSEALGQRFIDAAFSLAPANPEPPYSPDPAVGVVPLPGAAEVLVLQREDYRPAVEPQYQAGRIQLAARLMAERMWEIRRLWFATHAIEQRIDFVESGQKPAAAATQPATAGAQSP